MLTAEDSKEYMLSIHRLVNNHLFTSLSALALRSLLNDTRNYTRQIPDAVYVRGTLAELKAHPARVTLSTERRPTIQLTLSSTSGSQHACLRPRRIPNFRVRKSGSTRRQRRKRGSRQLRPRRRETISSSDIKTKNKKKVKNPAQKKCKSSSVGKRKNKKKKKQEGAEGQEEEAVRVWFLE